MCRFKGLSKCLQRRTTRSILRRLNAHDLERRLRYALDILEFLVRLIRQADKILLQVIESPLVELSLAGHGRNEEHHRPSEGAVKKNRIILNDFVCGTCQ
jgi:hypothetical protein